MADPQPKPGDPRSELPRYAGHDAAEHSEVRPAPTSSYSPSATAPTPPDEGASKTAPKPYRIVVGCDLGEMSDSVLLEAIEMAKGHAPAELHVITATRRAGLLYRLERDGESQELTLDALHHDAAEHLKHALARHQLAVEDAFDHVAIHVGVGRPAGEILSLADDVSADLIVVGDSSRSGFSRLLRRSTASAVVRRAATSVAVVRPVQFLEGQRLPRIEPPRPAGEGTHLGRRHTYHYKDRASTSGSSPISWEM